MAFAISLLHNTDLAEDVVHDCFCRLLSRRDRYDLPKDGLRLLLRSIANACVDRQRKAKTISRWQGSYSPKSAAWIVRDGLPLTPPDEVMRRELEEAITAALERLPSNQRVALQLKSLGIPLAEIADTLKVSPSNAGTLICRARRQMRKELKPILGIP